MSAPEEFQLRRHLPHLLRRAHFEAESLFTQVYGDAMTSRQSALLVAVGQLPKPSQSEVAQAVGLDLNTCSDLVARTISKGLLSRQRSPTDGRVFNLSLTPAGREVMEAAVASAERYADAVASKLEPAEKTQLVGLLRKLLGFEGLDRP